MILEKLKGDQLAAFIMARVQESDKTRYLSRSSLPKKGTAKLASEKDNCMVLIAYNYRDRENTIRDRFPHEEELDDGCNDVRITNISLSHDMCTVAPSDLLGNVEWVRNAIELFDLGGRSAEICDEEKQKADELVMQLKERHPIHIQKRVIQEQKQSHWCWKLAKKNLSVNAALMVLSEHVKEDLSVVSRNDDLLTMNQSRFRQCCDVPTREGAYLYFDRNNHRFIRSGKVTRRGFNVRHKEHLKASQEAQSSSNFYFFYPSLASARSSSGTKRGAFERLDQLVAAGFAPTSTAAQTMDKDWKEGGLLILSDEDKEQIKKKFGRVSELQKFQDICAYQLEYGYDLAIAPGNNVSESPGFESVLGVFGGDDKSSAVDHE